MAVPGAVSGIYVQSGDNQVFLSWSNTATATSYSIQRSKDRGVTFTNLGTSAINCYTDNTPATAVAVTSGGANLIVGQRYTISVVGTTSAAEWLTLGVPSGTTAAVGVTFTAAATGAGSGTGMVTILAPIYYYQVAGVNGSGTGAYTSTDAQGQPLVAIPAPSGIATLGGMRLQAQQRADLVNSNFVTLPEWNKYITQSCKELYDILISAYANDYYMTTPYTFSTSGIIDPNYNAQVFPLPDNFYKLFLCEVALNPQDPNSWVTLRQYNRIQQNLWNFPNVNTFYGITNLRYRLTGTQLQIVPIASAGQSIRIWYAPKPSVLVQDNDIFDGISGWEEYVIVDAAIKALKKEESDCMELMAEKAALMKRIDDMASARNISEPQTVSDSRSRNFAWSDGDGNGYGGGMW